MASGKLTGLHMATCSDRNVSPLSFLQQRTINLYKPKQPSKTAAVYPMVYKTAESSMIQSIQSQV